MADNLEEKCLLCQNPAELNRPFDEVWNRKCAESICKLLEISRNDFSCLFENPNYCSPCHEFVREIDFTLRTLAKLEEKCQDLRTVLSQMLLPNFERLWTLSRHEENDTVNSPVENLEPNQVRVTRSRSNKRGSKRIASKKTAANISATSQAAADSESENQHQNQLQDEEKTNRKTKSKKRPEYRIGGRDIVTILDIKDEDENSLADDYGDDLMDEIETPEFQPELAQQPDQRPVEQPTTAEDSNSTELQGRRRSKRITAKKKPNYRINQTEEKAQESDFNPENLSSDKEGEDDSSDDSVVSELEENTNKRKRRRRRGEGGRKRISRILFRPKYSGETVEEYEAKRELFKYDQGQKESLFDSEKDKFSCDIDGCTHKERSEGWINVHKAEHQASTIAKPNFDDPSNSSPCPVCNLQFATVKNQESHMERLHRPTVGLTTHFQCPLCPKKFGKTKVRRRQFREFQYHFKSIHVPREPETDNRRFPFLCPVRDCTSRCRTEKHLEIHRRKFHEKDPKPFKCDECPKEFRHASLLTHHKSRHHTGPAAVCHICAKGFVAKPSLAAHIKQAHPDAEKFTCEVCQSAFVFQEDCDAHVKRHKPNTFTCVLGYCYKFESKRKKDYGSAEALQQHIDEVHEKPFKCDVCDYTSTLKQNVESHKLKHTKVKRFLCKACPKAFPTKARLDSHEENKHPDPNNPKVYNCKLCPETFPSSQALYRHTFWHKHGSKERPPERRKPYGQDPKGDQEASKPAPRKRRKKQLTEDEDSGSEGKQVVDEVIVGLEYDQGQNAGSECDQGQVAGSAGYDLDQYECQYQYQYQL